MVAMLWRHVVVKLDNHPDPVKMEIYDIFKKEFFFIHEARVYCSAILYHILYFVLLTGFGLPLEVMHALKLLCLVNSCFFTFS